MATASRPPAGVRELFEALPAYLPAARVEEVKRAYDFAFECHDGQMRQSGEPYITHPVAVAALVAGLRMDAHTISAALLHDVVEDCGVTVEQLQKRFNDDVARLVEGATKIEAIQVQDASRIDAETLRKMFVAMAEDVRVVIIKLADRLHNMSTLEPLEPARQQRLSRETMEIYAPLAARLGIWQFKWQLEDLAFRYLQPEDYRRVSEIVTARRGERDRFVDDVEQELRAALEAAGINAEVSGRAKHLYSVHDKMRRYAEQDRSFDEIYDLLAVRVLVGSVADCYNALGVVHQTWHPIPGAFDDYIASPKESMYQSLHTSVLGPGAHPFEVQIRTLEMHEVAEYGVAAHWSYKGEARRRDVQYDERMSWLRHLVEWQQDASGTEDFLESVKSDVFADQVFVYTPKAEVRVLPRGSTPIDFAYRVHTDLGHQCAGARVNGRMVPLNTKLENGDVIEIIRARAPKGPSRDWLIEHLGYLGSSHSRQKVRQWFRRQQRSENIARGRELFDRERKRLGVREAPPDLAQRLGYADLEDMLAALGYGDVSLQRLGLLLAEHTQQEELALTPSTSRPAATPLGPGGVRVLGVGGLVTTLAHCCNPLPGDDIVGYTTRARGVTVHRATCRTVRAIDEIERLIDCDWGPVGNVYETTIDVVAWDRPGLLRDVAALVASQRVNIASVRHDSAVDGTITVHMTLETEGLAQLAALMTRLESVRGVTGVGRTEA
ncbi:MAG: bifunctional (p)ppGpp synthetase/guanosine-3',5'-bis(diphosphate) 3'-pyrophosphohydrolase [Dehalococcoidia bacterium]|nr:bifunctional (p)ppGpp synthetase/guanosine-3',5'-bis(diphosphate) 3'-pyrophosphohydrolase [Dehalococcoidia bacterium]